VLPVTATRGLQPEPVLRQLRCLSGHLLNQTFVRRTCWMRALHLLLTIHRTERTTAGITAVDGQSRFNAMIARWSALEGQVCQTNRRNRLNPAIQLDPGHLGPSRWDEATFLSRTGVLQPPYGTLNAGCM
jgi:hypothetical protein